MKTRVLCFIDNPLGRDTEIILPVTYGLEKYLDCEVRIEFIWNLFLIKTWKPDVLLLPNSKGHHMYFEAAKFCNANSITVLALESEGNFKTDGSFEYWGYNSDKRIYQEILTCWSNRVMEYLSKVLPQSEIHKLKLSGGTGFDRYSFDKFLDKQAFLSNHKLNSYQKIIGYVGWAFGKLYGAHLDQSFRHFDNWKKRDEALRWVEEMRIYVRENLRVLIESNPDTLFILKKHPKENFESESREGPNEMNELLHYPNVVYIRNEVAISDLINVSDVWLGFETTTAIEAWLLQKPTILINSEIEFPRSSPYKGSVIVEKAEQAQEMIDEFYSTGTISGFNEESVRSNRAKYIEDSIGFEDGLNHMRAVALFRKFIPKGHSIRSVKVNLRHLRLYLLMHLGRLFYNKLLFSKLPKFRKTIYVFENRKMTGFQERKEHVYKMLDKFHSEKKINDDISKNDWSRFQA